MWWLVCHWWPLSELTLRQIRYSASWYDYETSSNQAYLCIVGYDLNGSAIVKWREIDRMASANAIMKLATSIVRWSCNFFTIIKSKSKNIQIGYSIIKHSFVTQCVFLITWSNQCPRVYWTVYVTNWQIGLRLIGFSWSSNE